MITIIDHARCALLHGDSSNIARILAPNSVDSIVTDPPAGVGFMAKGWDSDKGGRDLWITWLRGIMTEALRVLKPGGHALVWALPRTSHWTATALEDAGFEIRDVGIHLFGTGFPKSLDVGKAIDQRLGATRELTGTTRPVGMATAASGYTDNAAWSGEVRDIPATSEAAAWDGWGTALKPAAEHWILARKPLIGTVAANVLAHGTGAINIDACRIGDATLDPTKMQRCQTAQAGHTVTLNIPGHEQPTYNAGGRWPAHVTLDPEAAEVLGEPSRFYFVAKGARSEKDAGLEHLPARTGGEATGREEGSAGTRNPRAGAGRTGGARNFHPTVKSIALMRWLIRLITPKGGTVLDLFAGSGTTGVAALQEGMSFVGIEQGGEGGEYIPIIRGRLENALKEAL